MVSAARAKKGLSQAELADRLQITKTYLSKIENKKVGLNLRLAARIAHELNCNLKDIVLIKN
jgi:transcriptional regulator with XRE-family HTH domain